MRLTELEKTTIISEVKAMFGMKSQVVLFGSRVDNEKKGGDIDLLIMPEKEMANDVLYQNKIKYLVAVKGKIGEQKIDVILPRLSSQNIIDTAIKTGIALC